MADNFTERDRRIDLQTREIAQEAKLDADLASVPPRWRATTVIVVSLILLALAVMIGSALI